MEYPILPEVEGFYELHSRIRQAETIEYWSYILSDHISWGNNKIAKSTAIFNLNPASDCPNKATKENGPSETGYCQVAEDECYAIKAEKQYPAPYQYRRRQEYLWDCLDPETFAKAFLQIVDRKRNDVSAIRFSEAGDFRHKGDIIKVDRIAEILSEHGINVYTYSASHKLDWSEAEHFTVNASNGKADYGDRRFMALPEGTELPDNTVWCPFDLGEPGDRIKCGECRLCVNKKGPNVAIKKH